MSTKGEETAEQAEKARLEKGLQFCEAYGVKFEVPKRGWMLVPASDVQIEAMRRFGSTQTSSPTKADAVQFLNWQMELAREARPPRVWMTDEEITAKSMQNTNRDHMQAVTERSALRAECLKLLGGRCAMCGVTDERVLQFDHIHDDGAEARRAGFVGDALYRDILLRGLAEYQILCANDNWRKRLAALEREKNTKK